MALTKDLKYSTSYRFGQFYQYTDTVNKRYDYKQEGIACKVFPAFLLKSNNPVLTRLMRTIDIWSITVLMMVDKVKNFKNIFKH